ncbi:DUF4145 domain-containing protein [Edwardsiella ictaluri]|uniref:DUF4145 domain-containing protein n=1 Tax=Edwardsiella ictaluri TaxID=67780 RepID=A0ABY8GKL7_EDWIC|nr:DUF4145 domain-containing protein [Edwardsiella ictaluri]ELV7529565.1 DUF4145 domain-containing protein [Edwardsiella ictaluri]WFN97911.1 DUF4145 domain-containing protein [Edwardsiella ictaluri]
MDRKKLTSYFSRAEETAWECPTCKSGLLKIIDNSFQRKETFKSHATHAYHDGQWFPEYVEYVYSCLFQCSKKSCGEIISSSGIGFMDIVEYKIDENNYHDPIYGDYFRPRYFEPALNLISVPDNCPSPVFSSLKESFKLFFTSPNAAANNIRIAVERLLTELGVPDRTAQGGFIKLHNRIEQIPSDYKIFKDALLAIKWNGNAGSHQGGNQLSVDDVIDIYEIIEDVLKKIYDSDQGRIAEIIARINKNKGPGE